MLEMVGSQGVDIRMVPVPKEAKWFYYAGKVYAAGEAETAAEGQTEILIWLDEDTVIIDEPSHFNLSDDVDFAYVPVMHNRSGSLLEKSPDPFWERIYGLLSIDEDMLFPMVTPADKQTIRAYFHCGLIVARPEKGILRRWVKDFEILYNDPSLTEMCQSDANKRIFLHQTALTGALLLIPRMNMKPLPSRYNYPIFFEKQYGGIETFDSLENIVSVRCVVSRKNMGENWPEKLSGPPDRIAWLKEHF
ncbi:MAG: hypothetical protein JSV52_14455 [Candidatus Zixiibacteriota bacterium]|nr:MAG: hypothetical protein JSV52_14455 [candidate division Zixibacteria bacterium]